MKKACMILLLVLVFIPGSIAMAQPGPGRICIDEGLGWAMRPSLLSRLDLSPEQSEKINKLRISLHKDLIPMRSRLFTKRAELRLLWLQTKLDPEKIRQTQKEILDLLGQIQNRVTRFRLEFRNVLTEEQVSKLLALSFERPWRPGPRRGLGWKRSIGIK